ncbi:unnamed protein product, partial [Discosporangium mesarthrocarpum]
FNPGPPQPRPLPDLPISISSQGSGTLSPGMRSPLEQHHLGGVVGAGSVGGALRSSTPVMRLGSGPSPGPWTTTGMALGLDSGALGRAGLAGTKEEGEGDVEMEVDHPLSSPFQKEAYDERRGGETPPPPTPPMPGAGSNVSSMASGR